MAERIVGGDHCELPPYCPSCVQLHAGRAIGTAHARGRTWARRILARRLPSDPPLAWDTPRALAIAESYVEDVTSDARVRAILVPVVIAAAQAELARPTCGPHEIRRYTRAAEAARRRRG